MYGTRYPDRLPPALPAHSVSPTLSCQLSRPLLKSLICQSPRLLPTAPPCCPRQAPVTQTHRSFPSGRACSLGPSQSLSFSTRRAPERHFHQISLETVSRISISNHLTSVCLPSPAPSFHPGLSTHPCSHLTCKTLHVYVHTWPTAGSHIQRSRHILPAYLRGEKE